MKRPFVQGVHEHCFGTRVNADAVLFVKRPERIGEYRSLLRASTSFGGVWKGVAGRLLGLDVAIIATGVGPSNVGDAALALGSVGKIWLYSGTCGSLRDDLLVGNPFVASSAVCGDGFSMYCGRKPFDRVDGDRDLSNAAAEILGPATQIGRAFTTSSFVRELEPAFWKMVPGECDVIEMGAAAFFTAANATLRRAVAQYWVTDWPRQEVGFMSRLPAKWAVRARRRFNMAPRRDLDLLAALATRS